MSFCRWSKIILGLVLVLGLSLPGGVEAYTRAPAKAGFPVSLGSQPVEWSSVLVLPNASGSAIFVGDGGGRLWKVNIIRRSASVVSISKRALIYSAPISSSPSSWTGDVRSPLYFGYGADVRNRNAGGIAKINPNTFTKTWQVAGRDRNDGTERRFSLDSLAPAAANGVPDGVFGAINVSDLDADGNPELVYGGWDHHVYARRYGSGALYSSNWPFFCHDTIWGTPAVADLNGDGYKEIVVGSDLSLNPANNWSHNGGRMWFFNRNGTVWHGWDQVSPRDPALKSNQTFYSSPAIGDINNDGQYEIVCGTGIYWCTSGRGGSECTGTRTGRQVFGWRANGTNLPGWPAPLGGAAMSSPALADLDVRANRPNGDRRLETIIGCEDGRVYCITPTGRIRWRTLLVDVNGQSANTVSDPDLTAVRTSPVVADIDGDGDLEILVSWRYEVVILDHTGRLLTGPRSARNIGYVTNWSLFASPAVADIDGDGLLDIVVAGGKGNGTGALWAWSTTARVGSPTPWWTFHRDAQRSGFVPR